MDTFTHTLFALASMGACWAWGRYFSTKDIIENMLIMLERDGYIKTEIDEDGDKCLVKLKKNQ